LLLLDNQQQQAKYAAAATTTTTTPTAAARYSSRFRYYPTTTRSTGNVGTIVETRTINKQELVFVVSINVWIALVDESISR